ncbi:PspC domain-containing protein [Nesterenkonia haasae]|uniref:PspC domain-containing protein n=1 Tax=Nesterenkonia haasae TaxID=2587813 RepID=UPI001391D5C0|nr:PspC domain-containing protein [Nesterenkonia haasae]NDK32890.1 PspC domain-containing protein [Nesterenkonia haasae]
MSTSDHGRREAGHQVFDWVRTLGLERPDNAWAAGVCAAVAQKLGWDTALVRGIGVVAFIIFFSPMALFYGLSWMFLPDSRGHIHAQQALRGSYPAGFWGAGILTLVGAVNVFTPNIVGPFAILLNLVIIGLVAWLLWAIFRGYQRNTGNSSAQGNSPKAGASAHRSADSKPPAEAKGTPREDGKPAWYPKEGPPPAGRSASAAQSGPQAHSYAESSHSGTSHATAGGMRVSPPPTKRQEENPRVAEEKRRRRMVSFGLALLAVPMIAAAMWFATTVGLATTNAVLLGLALVVTLLALMHLGAAVRGTRGRAGLLGTFTVLMLVVFLFAPSNLESSSNHVFGNYETQSETVNTAFANTTVDLRNLSDRFAADDEVDFSDATAAAEFFDTGDFHTTVDVNNAFANTTVVLPDDVYWEIDPRNFMGNMDIRTQSLWDSYQGIGATPQDVDPEVAAGTVELKVGNAFGNVVIYDETTYKQEELGIFSDEEEQE